MDQKIVVVRTDWDNIEWIWNRIQRGQIHQGWGLPNTQLVENDESVQVDTWKPRYIESAKTFWGVDVTDADAEKRFWILNPMIN